MGYLNPIEVMGYGPFAEAAAQAGIDGTLTVDLPPEEAHDLLQTLTKQGIDPIFLLAPTTDDARIECICQVASGYVYYVSLKGVTGAATLDTASVAAKLEQIRQHTTLPVGVGFGIKDAQSAAAVANVADAVVVGSALIQTIVAHLEQPVKIRKAMQELLSGMREAMDKRN
jgi:tryptophan synthase alpha chain